MAQKAIAKTFLKQQGNIVFKQGTGYNFTQVDDKFVVEDDMRGQHEYTQAQFDANFDVNEFEPTFEGYGAVDRFPGNK